MASRFERKDTTLTLLTDMLLMVEKDIRGRICNPIHWYAKANNKYMTCYDKNKESSCGNYWDVNNFLDGQYYLMIIIFNDMVADMLSNKKLTPIVTELFIRGRKLNISLVFITKSYFAFQKILD